MPSVNKQQSALKRANKTKWPMHEPTRVPEPRNSAFFPKRKQGQKRPIQPVQCNKLQLAGNLSLAIIDYKAKKHIQNSPFIQVRVTYTPPWSQKERTSVFKSNTWRIRIINSLHDVRYNWTRLLPHFFFLMLLPLHIPQSAFLFQSLTCSLSVFSPLCTKHVLVVNYKENFQV